MLLAAHTAGDAYFIALAAAITDASRVAGLEQFERWNSLTSLPLDRIASWCAAPSSEAP